jgi:tetratricopeptide (TPR) repeat protein
MSELCTDERLSVVTAAVSNGSPDRIEQIDLVLRDHPSDPRLHFLKGSVLVGDGRLIEAHQSLRRAVDLAPDFAVARFQLGFFQLTSGEPENALESWGRLDQLPDGHYMRKFVDGLRCLIRDDFDGAVRNLREGISLNDENLPMSSDMQLIVDRCIALMNETSTSAPGAVDSASETSLILGQFTNRTRH